MSASPSLARPVELESAFIRASRVTLEGGGPNPVASSTAARAALASRLAEFEARYQGVDVAMVTCPPWSVISPHIGVAYVIGYLKAVGIKARLFDMNIDLFHALGTDFWDLWRDLQNKNEVNSLEWFRRVYTEPASRAVVDDYVERIIASQPKVVGFSVIYRNTHFANEIARLLKEKAPWILTVAGGPETTTCYKGGDLWRLREIMPHIDCFGIGEGEVPLRKLAMAVRRHQVEQFAAETIGTWDHMKHRPVAAAKGIPGILVVENLEEFHYEKAEIVDDIDEIPTPDYSQFEIAKYGGGVWPFLFSRGCILKCAFCLSYATFGRYRSKSAEKNFKEIKEIVETYNINNFEFNDLEVNGDLETLSDFCDMVIEDNLKITWFGYFVARKDMTQPLFDKIRAAGCYRARFGGESGSTRVLKMMNKALTAEVFARNVEMSWKAGLETTINVIVGFPGETEEMFVETLEFIRATHPYLHHIANVSMCTLVPNSDLAKNPKKYGILPGLDGDLNYRWRTVDGQNTFEVRLDRMVRTLELCRELGIMVDIANWEISDTTRSPERVKEMMRWYREKNAWSGSASPSMRPHPASRRDEYLSRVEEIATAEAVMEDGILKPRAHG